jgi:hypothetical protein
MKVQGFVVSLSLLGGCMVDGVDEPETSTTEEELLGAVNFGGDCNAQKTAFLGTVARYGRTVAVTRAFEQCVERTLISGTSAAGGRYRQCNGEPFFGSAIATQVDMALDAARSGNDIMLNCTGGGGNASAYLGPYDRTDTETLNFSGWLDAVVGVPRSGAWPFSQAANIVWHEMMHQHGYDHGASYASDPAVVAAENAVHCGYAASDTSYHYQANSMPYLIGNCTSAILDQSAATCGDIDSCGPGMVKLVTGLGAQSCECVADPNGVTTRPSNAFVHIAQSWNSGSGMTTLSHPLLDGRSNAIVHIQHLYNAPGNVGTYLGHRSVPWYNFSTGRWVIQNQHGAQMPLGSAFIVRVGRGTVHRTSAANTSGHITTIDHPLANGNPSAILTVTPAPYAGAWSGTVNDHAIGVWFDGGMQRWRIYNQDYVAMPLDSGFHVEVETPRNRGLHFTHVVTTANRSSHMTRVSSPFLDGNPNAMFLVTPNWRTGVYNMNEFGVWFDGASWWIYNEANGTSGATMPMSAGFDIEILRTEVQRWIRVPENTFGVDTGIDIQPSDRLRIHGYSRIWSGWLLSPTVGAEGENGLPQNSNFPLLTAPRFSLLGRLPTEGNFFVGRDLSRGGSSSTQRLTLRTNDDVPGNGSGFFEAEVRAFR